MIENYFLTEDEDGFVSNALYSLYYSNGENTEGLLNKLISYRPDRQRLIINSLSHNVLLPQRLRRDYIMSSLVPSGSKVDAKDADIIISALASNRIPSPDIQTKYSLETIQLDHLPSNITEQIIIYKKVGDNFEELMSWLYAIYNVSPLYALLASTDTDRLTNLSSSIQTYISDVSRNGTDVLLRYVSLPNDLKTQLTGLQLSNYFSDVTLTETIRKLTDILAITIGIIKNRGLSKPMVDIEVKKELGRLFYLSNKHLDIK